MINIDSYMNDGACWQAQAVLAFLRAKKDVWQERTWNDERRAYDVSLEVGRFENCREQGYVFSVTLPVFCSKDGYPHQMNWAVYEHRNSDQICVLISDAFTINTPSIEEMFKGRSKWDVDAEFPHHEVVACGSYINKSIKAFISENYKEEGE